MSKNCQTRFERS